MNFETDFNDDYAFILSTKSLTRLTIEKDVILREMRQIHACDGLSCFYCKDWTQTFYKYFFRLISLHYPKASF